MANTLGNILINSQNTVIVQEILDSFINKNPPPEHNSNLVHLPNLNTTAEQTVTDMTTGVSAASNHSALLTNSGSVATPSLDSCSVAKDITAENFETSEQEVEAVRNDTTSTGGLSPSVNKDGSVLPGDILKEDVNVDPDLNKDGNDAIEPASMNSETNQPHDVQSTQNTNKEVTSVTENNSICDSNIKVGEEINETKASLHAEGREAKRESTGSPMEVGTNTADFDASSVEEGECNDDVLTISPFEEDADKPTSKEGMDDHSTHKETGSGTTGERDIQMTSTPTQSNGRSFPTKLFDDEESSELDSSGLCIKEEQSETWEGLGAALNMHCESILEEDSEESDAETGTKSEEGKPRFAAEVDCHASDTNYSPHKRRGSYYKKKKRGRGRPRSFSSIKSKILKSPSRIAKSPSRIAKSPKAAMSPNMSAAMSDNEFATTPKNVSDISNLEELLLVFDHGWRREVVIRGIYEEYTKAGKPKRIPADVYYFTPEGTKLRSIKNIVQHLEVTKSPLGENNFSFLKKPIHKPPGEMVRTAGSRGVTGRTHPSVSRPPGKGSPKQTPTSSKTKSAKDVPEVYIERDEPDLSFSQLVSPEPGNVLTMSPKAQDSTPIREATPEVETELVTKATPKRPWEENDAEMSQQQPTKKVKSVARKSTTQGVKKPIKIVRVGSAISAVATPTKDQLCSMSCPGLEGSAPSLHCGICMCLFHPACVNFTPKDDIDQFVCLRCNDTTGNPTEATSIMRVTKKPKPIAETKTTNSLVPKTVDSGSENIRIHNLPTVTSLANSLGLQISNLLNQNEQALAMKDNGNDLRDNAHLKTLLKSKICSSGVEALSSNQSLPALNRKPLGQAVVSQANTTVMMPHGALLAPPTSQSFLNGMASVISPISQAVTLSGLQMCSNLPSIFPGTAPARPPSMVVPPPPRLKLAPGISLPNISPKQSQSSVATEGNVTIAPKEPPVNIPVNAGAPEQGQQTKHAQVITLSSSTAKRLNLGKPLALRAGNLQIIVPPSSFVNTPEGLKIILPPSTFPLQSGATVTMNVTLQDPDKLAAVAGNKADVPTKMSMAFAKDTEKLKTSCALRTRQNKCEMQKLYLGFDCMMCMFKFLNAGDLIRASRVCKTWKRIIDHPVLWRVTRLRDTQVKDWTKAATFFRNHGTDYLDMRGLVHYDDKNRTWHQLSMNLTELKGIRRLDLGLVPSSVLHFVCENLENLEILNAEWISDFYKDQIWTTPTKLDVGKFSKLTKLKSLLLRGTGGLSLPAFSFSGGLESLGTMTNLKSLSLTTLRGTSSEDMGYLEHLSQLEVLEIGDCTYWSSDTWFILGKLINLKKLRLECGGEIPDNGLGAALLNLMKLETLELIMFVVADTLQLPLLQLDQLRRLTIWPDTKRENAAQVNSNTLAVVSKLAHLKQFQWGVITSKSNSAAHLQLDDTPTDQSANNRSEDWLPFLSDTPHPQIEDMDTEDSEALSSDYISLNTLEDKLAKSLPNAAITVQKTRLVNFC